MKINELNNLQAKYTSYNTSAANKEINDSTMSKTGSLFGSKKTSQSGWTQEKTEFMHEYVKSNNKCTQLMQPLWSKANVLTNNAEWKDFPPEIKSTVRRVNDLLNNMSAYKLPALEGSANYKTEMQNLVKEFQEEVEKALQELEQLENKDKNNTQEDSTIKSNPFN